MQDNSQAPSPLHHSISPSSIPLSLHPSTPFPSRRLCCFYIRSFSFFSSSFPCLFSLSILISSLHPTAPPNPSIHSFVHPPYFFFFFSLHPTCLLSSLPWIIPLIRRGACNTAVAYNMSVVITDSLAVLH